MRSLRLLDLGLRARHGARVLSQQHLTGVIYALIIVLVPVLLNHGRIHALAQISDVFDVSCDVFALLLHMLM